MREHTILLQNAVIGAVSTALTVIVAQSGLFFSKVIAREATQDDLPATAYVAAHGTNHHPHS